MIFRQFSESDAEFCFKTRSNAFIQKFYGELTPEEIAAGVNAFMPNDYIKMSRKMPAFIVEENDIRLGFFTLKHLENNRAELPLIYVDLDRLGNGIGSACLKYMESWLAVNWPEVNALVVDTVIPLYNSGFYQKAGFVALEEIFCEFSGLKIKALRLTKSLTRTSRNQERSITKARNGENTKRSQ
jgi:GNAT superfamily N-acetyltransferase